MRDIYVMTGNVASDVADIQFRPVQYDRRSVVQATFTTQGPTNETSMRHGLPTPPNHWAVSLNGLG